MLQSRKQVSEHGRADNFAKETATLFVRIVREWEHPGQESKICQICAMVEQGLTVTYRYRLVDIANNREEVRSTTNNNGWHPGRFFFYGFIAFLAVVGTIAAIGYLLRPAVPAYYPFTWGFFPFGFFFAFFWIFAVFWFIRFLFWPWRWGMGRRYWGQGWGYGDRAYYILRERYARGEITKDQYDQMMRDLQQHNQAV